MKIGIFGSSGFAREVADICDDIGYLEIFFVDDSTAGQNISGITVVGNNEVVSLADQGFVFTMGIGNPIFRHKIRQMYPELIFPNIIHPSVTFGRGQMALIERSIGNIFAAGCRITNNTVFGNFCIFNLNVTIGHDCIIHDYVSVMPGVNISGNVEAMDAVYIGTSAAILQGGNEKKLTIGENTIIGAGAVVVKNCPANVTMTGVPAKVLLPK